MNVLIALLAAFFIANLLGYGGGPASIPLMYQEVVDRYHWLTNTEFSKMLALGNALPGPIATKIAAYVGYDIVGWVGLLVAMFATVVPSAVALILLLKLLQRHRQSKVVKGMTLLVQPVIAIMMVILTWEMGRDSVVSLGLIQTVVIGLISLVAMTKFKVHPAILILIAFAYGGLVVPHI